MELARGELKAAIDHHLNERDFIDIYSIFLHQVATLWYLIFYLKKIIINSNLLTIYKPQRKSVSQMQEVTHKVLF